MAAKKTKLTEDQRAMVARALADPRRFAILQQIASKPVMQCSGLDAQTCISPATISHHLKGLQEAGLIDIRHEGRIANLTLRRDIWDAYLGTLAQI